jgi:hypothetical protein
MRIPHHEIDILLSKSRATGPALCWLAFYVLAVVTAVVANFDQVIKVALAAWR